jgi:hypothetical protein
MRRSASAFGTTTGIAPGAPWPRGSSRARVLRKPPRSPLVARSIRRGSGRGGATRRRADGIQRHGDPLFEERRGLAPAPLRLERLRQRQGDISDLRPRRQRGAQTLLGFSRLAQGQQMLSGLGGSPAPASAPVGRRAPAAAGDVPAARRVRRHAATRLRQRTPHRHEVDDPDRSAEKRNTIGIQCQAAPERTMSISATIPPERERQQADGGATEPDDTVDEEPSASMASWTRKDTRPRHMLATSTTW